MAKRTNNDLQNITRKTNDRATRISLKTAPRVTPVVLLLNYANFIWYGNRHLHRARI